MGDELTANDILGLDLGIETQDSKVYSDDLEGGSASVCLSPQTSHQPNDMRAGLANLNATEELLINYADMKKRYGLTTLRDGIKKMENLPQKRLFQVAAGLFQQLEAFSEKAGRRQSIMSGSNTPSSNNLTDSSNHSSMASLGGVITDVDSIIPQQPSSNFYQERRQARKSVVTVTPLDHTGGLRPLSADSLFAGGLRTMGSLASLVGVTPVSETQRLQKSVDEEGNKTINDYSILADLGKGSFAKVKLAVNNKNDKVVAMKIIKKQMLNKQKLYGDRIQREIAIMKKLRHKNIVSLFEVIDDPESAKLYLVMQYVENGPIVSMKNDFSCCPLDDDRALRVVRQLISGLRYLHKRDVIHRDIKPDNILAGKDDTVYLADFGVSEMVSGTSKSVNGTEGTPLFLAPELLRKDANHVDGIMTDVWALGVTVYCMIFGRAPFVGDSYTAITQSILKQPLTFPSGMTPIQSKWKDPIEKLLHKDPAKRWTLAQLKRHKIFDVLARKAGGEKTEIDVTPEEVSRAMRHCKVFCDEEEEDGYWSKLSPNTLRIIKQFANRIRKKAADVEKKQRSASIARHRVSLSSGAYPAPRGSIIVATKNNQQPRPHVPKIPKVNHYQRAGGLSTLEPTVTKTSETKPVKTSTPPPPGKNVSTDSGGGGGGGSSTVRGGIGGGHLPDINKKRIPQTSRR